MRISWLPCFLLFFSASVWAGNQTITLVLPAQSDNGHAYYHELLTRALADQGIDLIIETPYPHLPQKRVVKMVENDQLSLTWLLESPERNQHFAYIDIPLTHGLIGQRILLIPPSLQSRFDNVATLDDLRKTLLIAGLGEHWVDITVWRYNQLPFYIQNGEWRELYKKLSVTGEVNYFPRGVTEIYQESILNPHLAIEQHLLLQYQNDFRFYLSPKTAQYKDTLEQALQKAVESGLMDRLIEQYWGKSLSLLRLNQRQVIELKMPEKN
ncbi:hypothetical protein V7T16_05430 [Vibrio metoecus]|uniref:ABC transporter substrate-binding protein n=1 Tax=Vibrio metoecus TaxID=1481663 RepID=A0A271VTR2_VIBMT|nr:hypothetical protein [Vibrio metoecus]KQB08314.1 hypothetical protein XV94_15805 [Vibrio metoecus]PAR21553.1 hypothetical protein CGU03_07560 [Vibrio metoecus]PAR25905.1 hypothetical protein CGU02_02540 [Vibrio metoecus]